MSTHDGPVLRFIRQIAPTGGVRDRTDKDLLERFTSGEDPAAFAALLQRHGAVVWGVCRRVLDDAHAAEDVFQATFLVFLRKARSLSKPELLGNWLYGVAYRTAIKVRSEAAKRWARETPLADMPAVPIGDDVDWRDVRAVLDEEVNRLPNKYRAPFVLCYLEGKTTEEIAQQLRCPKGTVGTRLAWARERLRNRLTRRGIALSAGTLTALFSRDRATAAALTMSDPIIQATLRLAASDAGSAIPPRVAALAERVLKTMWMKKVKSVLAVLLVAGAMSAGVGVWAHRPLAPDPTAARAASETKPADRGLEAPSGAVKVMDQGRLQGSWKLVSIEQEGKLFVDEEVDSFWTFTGDNLRYTRVPKTERARQVFVCGPRGGITWRLDPSKKPKEIDLLIDRMPYLIGIYELDGDNLRICRYLPPNRKGRPTEFVTKPEGGTCIVNLKKTTKK